MHLLNYTFVDFRYGLANRVVEKLQRSEIKGKCFKVIFNMYILVSNLVFNIMAIFASQGLRSALLIFTLGIVRRFSRSHGDGLYVMQLVLATMSLVKSSLENQPYYNLESIFRAFKRKEMKASRPKIHVFMFFL